MKVFGALAAAAALAMAAAPALHAEEIPFRITLNTGPNHVRNIALEEFVKTLKERTEGKLDVQVFPSSQLFKGPDVPKALAQGGVEMGVPIILYLSSVVPDTGLLDLPMFYGRSADEVHAVIDGEVGAELNAEIEAKLGVKVLGPYLDLGHTSIFTTDVPATSLAALDGLRLRVPGSPASKVRYEEMGVESVAISFADVPIALAQHSIDGLNTTHETIRSAKLWESGLKYAIDTQENFLVYVPMVGKPTWDKLGPELQQIVLDSWADTVDDARKLAASRQIDARAEGIANGIQAVQASEEELAAFRARLLARQDEIVAATRMDPDFVARAAAVLGD
ncbi:TRAP transporter substrate-binding protein DctP [Frigidibacter sp. ROC022]|uniref:TRAP transporter substrate-binding protein DctP n=1 Tax=Frigidibacter sp. ROC022 TaxID=2971796 RepID=UPI00215A4C8B|nr:TRAP transporter substrate-binding protein DctP [Frigidibacter sp. ROC022]MCR8725787.1 TRAP transporter substrate-binding protein DctP [Frigidibacter sp. ROC022]